MSSRPFICTPPRPQKDMFERYKEKYGEYPWPDRLTLTKRLEELGVIKRKNNENINTHRKQQNNNNLQRAQHSNEQCLVNRDEGI